MAVLTIGSLSPLIISSVPGSLAFVATTAPGTPTLLPGLLAFLSALG